MTVKKDASGRRSIQVEVEVPGAPEEVWQAIATGPGISSWFVPSEVDEREGGNVAFHLGEGMDSTGKVTAWQPPRRFAYEERNWSGEAPPLATEWIVEARGGTCVVRVVSSLFTTSDQWDTELESQEQGWPPFFAILRLMQTHFRGQRCETLRLLRQIEGPEPAAWQRLVSPLGLASAKPGQRRSTPETGGPAFAGCVERVSEKKGMHELLLRLEEPATGLAVLCTGTWQEQVFATLNLHFFGETAGDILVQYGPTWRTWLYERTSPPKGAAGEASQAD